MVRYCPCMHPSALRCPHCHQSLDVWVDPSGGQSQTYVEDCAVCCRPLLLRITLDDDGEADLEVEPAQ